MKEVSIRYSKVNKKFPRELVLLQGTGCFWKKCTFCDYYLDISKDPFVINNPIIDRITGDLGVLDVINSGSPMELDKQTLEYLMYKIREKNIKEVWFEAHWAYRNILSDFAKKFYPAVVKFRTGAETFDGNLRKKWNKGISENISAEEIAKYFQSISLLVGVKGQNFSEVTRDIELADKFFEHFMINIFEENSKGEKRNDALILRFKKEIYPKIKDNPKAEIFFNITDGGVG